ncbi:hypothetical protein Tco_0621806 [Tanacetum coccineum]
MQETLKWKLNLLKNTLYYHYGLLILQQSRAQKQRMEMKSLMGILVQRQMRRQKIQEDQAFLEELERLKRQEKEANDAAEAFRKEFAQCTEDLLLQAGAARATSTNTVNTVSTPISTASPSRVFSAGGPDLTNNDQDDSQIPALEDIYDNPSDGIFTNASYDDEGAVADFTNLETTVNVSPIPTSRIHSIHPTTQILGDPTSAVQTRSKVNKSSGAHAFVSYIQKQRRNNHKDFQHCLFACFLSQIEPKKISQDLEDKSWYEAMQEELLQFKIQKNKKDERGVVVRNKARSWCDEFEPLMKSRFQMSSMGELTFFLGLHTACTPIETHKPLVKDAEAANVDVHLYRFQVTPKTLHLYDVKRIFRYLKGKPKLGLWYPRELSFDLVAYSDSDYGGANLDRKSTTGEAEYVAAANCCGQVLRIQNQMLDYGFNFMNTRIYIDNESTICIVKNPVFTQKQSKLRLGTTTLGSLL